MTFSHSENKFENELKNKSNFIFNKYIKKFNYNPIPEFINLVEKNKFSFLYESVENLNQKEEKNQNLNQENRNPESLILKRQNF